MNRMESNILEPASFRDPDGFLFFQNNRLYRQVNHSYRQDYEHLLESGLYTRLTGEGLLLPHEEASVTPPEPDACYKVIKPELCPFVSYPYEWCFSQLKDVALATLKIQQFCLEYGMSLKDASAYNIQFIAGNPVLIDSLSFEKYREGYPWVAYRQFCQHFLAPLALMSYRDIRSNRMLAVFLDGIPLDMASAMLPLKTRFLFSLLSHIHLHAGSQKRFAASANSVGKYKMSRTAFSGIIQSLESAIRKLKWQPGKTEWASYYQETSYSDKAFEHKKQVVGQFLTRANPAAVWDLGANTGKFSRIASGRSIPVVSFDVDPSSVEINYRQVKANSEACILPLVMDLTNPSPGIGWNNTERMSLFQRGPVDAAMALALIHHLAISNNLPLDRIAGFFHRLCKHLIIEWVPKQDSQVQRLLATRKDIFPNYTREGFEKAFSQFFKILDSSDIHETQRTVFLMERSA